MTNTMKSSPRPYNTETVFSDRSITRIPNQVAASISGTAMNVPMEKPSSVAVNITR